MDEKSRKQVPLRITKDLYDKLMKMASDDFRSLNGEIEYILTMAVRHRAKGNEKDE